MYNPRKPQFTVFKVKQDGTLLPFVMQCLDGISRSKAKAILAGGGVRVNQKKCLANTISNFGPAWW